MGAIAVLVVLTLVAAGIAAVASLPWFRLARRRGIVIDRWEFLLPCAAYPLFLFLALLIPNLGGREAFGLLDGTIAVPLAGATYMLTRFLAGGAVSRARARGLAVGVELLAFAGVCVWLYHAWP